MTTGLPVPPLPVETILPGEQEAVEHIVAVLERQLTERYVARKLPVRRDAHPKTLSLVRARFVVNRDCPAELRHGVFASPGRVFDADIRFSSGNPEVRHDLVPDVRGMAVKLPQVPGDFLPDGGQDFLMATGEAFFGTDVIDYRDFPEASERLLATAWYFIRKWRRHRAGLNLLSAMVTPPSPLALEYFSQTPYRLGPHCVKYYARPFKRRSPVDDPWYMRAVFRRPIGFLATLGLTRWLPFPFDAERRALMRDLATGPVRYELLVQRWPDLSTMPAWAIEDASRKWPAAWVPVATIDIVQQCRIADRDAEAERMSFSPWHARLAHQPLGSINRARLAVYRSMSTFRNAKNQGGNPGGAHAIVRPSDDDHARSGTTDPPQ